MKYCIFIVILSIICLSSANGENRAAKLDLSTDISKQILRAAKSADIQAMLDAHVDPCDDFYKYSCGRWHRHNPAQLTSSIITDRFQMLAQAFERRLENFLEHFENTTHDALPQKIRDFYISCQLIDADRISYVLHLENIIKEYGSLPVLAKPEWKEADDFIWWETIAHIQHKYGKQILLAVDIMRNMTKSSSNSLYIGAPIYAMGSNSKFMQQLQQTRVEHDLKRYFGVEQELAEKTARDMIAFESAIIKSGTNTQLNMQLEDLLSLKELDSFDESALYGFNITKYLEIVLDNAQQVPESIYIYDEQYFKNVIKIINDTPKSTVANYILWQLLSEYILESGDNNQAKQCQLVTKKYFGKYLDYAIYQSYKTAKQERDVQHVWQQLRETFHNSLQGDKLDWITNATRTYAIEKLNAMSLHIKSYEDVDFNEIYANLSINRLGYVQNIQQLLMLQAANTLSRFTAPTAAVFDNLDSLSASYTTSYNLLDNTIYIPVALLQPRFFWDQHYPQAVKYATLGYLLAHEMIHGFDDAGRHHDKHGNKLSWWDEKSAYEFEARRKCLRGQYQNFKYEGHHLPNSISQSENIADNAAVRLAYNTYIRWLNTQAIEEPDIELKETLPGLVYDNRQLFFISFAQLWCVDVQILFKYSLAAADTHAPNMYRVIGSLSNFQEFSWVFKCNPSARMDPKYKCYLF